MEEDLCCQQEPLITDVAVHLFSFLSVSDRQNVAKVCRYWRNTVYHTRLWKEVHVVLPLNSSDTLINSLNTRKITRYTCLRSTEDELSCLLTNIANLTHLDIKGCPQISRECLMRTLKSLTNLEHLSFSRCRQVTNNVLSYYANAGSFDKMKSLALEDCNNVTDVGFKAIIKNLKNLETLRLKSERLNDGCLKTLCDSCPKLTCLKLASCDWVTISGLQHITQKLKHIKTLDLNSSHGIADEGIRLVAKDLDLQSLDIAGWPGPRTETISFIARNLNGLRRLSFSGGGFFAWYDVEVGRMCNEISKLTELEYLSAEVFDEKYDRNMELCFISLLKKLPKLKFLNLKVLRNIGEESAKAIADGMPELTSLTLNSKRIDDNSVTTLCSGLNKLETLDLNRCNLTDHGFKAIATGLPNLKSLKLMFYHEITDEGVKHIASNLKSLITLELKFCHKLTDAGVELIAKGMPQLVSLNLTYCHQVSDKGAIMIGKHLRQLQHLILDNTIVTDQGFIFICEHLQNLRVLGAGSCPLTDKGLIDGSMFLGNLEELDVGSDSITDEGIREAVKFLGGLTEMTLSSSSSVTVVGVEYILLGLPNLTYLQINECDKITDFSVRHLQDNRRATISVYRNDY